MAFRRRIGQTRPVLPNLEQRVAAVVTAQLETLNGELEAIVDRVLQAELDRRVAQLLDTEVETRAESSPSAEDSAAAPESVLPDGQRAAEKSAAMKTCTSCGEEKPATSFERHRNQCKSCRWKAGRERRDQKAEEASAGPFAGTTSTG
jgi:hypothetical protein